MTGGVELRAAQPDDDDFLFAVYASTREEELAAVPWDAAARTAFLRQQYGFRTTHYAQARPTAATTVVVRDGDPVGSLIVDRSAGEIALVDIALLAPHRNTGIGTTVLRGLLDEADRSGAPVRLTVELTNPAKRWYERHGFVEVDADALRASMTREPRAVS